MLRTAFSNKHGLFASAFGDWFVARAAARTIPLVAIHSESVRFECDKLTELEAALHVCWLISRDCQHRLRNSELIELQSCLGEVGQFETRFNIETTEVMRYAMLYFSCHLNRNKFLENKARASNAELTDGISPRAKSSLWSMDNLIFSERGKAFIETFTCELQWDLQRADTEHDATAGVPLFRDNKIPTELNGLLTKIRQYKPTTEGTFMLYDRWSCGEQVELDLVLQQYHSCVNTNKPT